MQYGYNGKWLGYGDINTVYTPYTVNLPQGPDSTVELEDYSMTYFNEIGGPRVGHMVKCAVVDNKMYIQGASQYIPEAWLVGDIDGNKVTFTEQQAGLLDYYYTDFRVPRLCSETLSTTIRLSRSLCSTTTLRPRRSPPTTVLLWAPSRFSWQRDT